MKSSIIFFWSKINKKRKSQLFFLLLLSILTSLVELVSIGAVMPFLGALTAPESLYENKDLSYILHLLSINNPSQLLPLFSIFFIVFILMSGFLRITLLWVQTRIGFAIGVDLGQEIFKNSLYLPYSEHLKRNSSKLISGLTNKTSQVVTNLIIPLLLLVSSSVILLFIFLLLVFVNPSVAILSLSGFALIYLFIYLIVKKHLDNLSQKISSYQDHVVKIIQESVGGFRDILLDASHPVFSKAYLQADTALRRAMGNNVIIANSPRFGIEAIAMVAVILMANIFAMENNSIVDVLPVMGLLVFTAQRMLPVLQQVFSSISIIKGAAHTAKDVVGLLKNEQSHIDQNQNVSSFEKLEFKDKIIFSNISYRFSPDEPWVFRKLNLQFIKGEKIGIVGKTGSGKSTLVDVLLGLLPPIEGEFYIDDVIINRSNKLAWQKNIAHVPQTIYLSDLTIAENIAFGIPINKIDYDRVRRVSVKAQLSETIESWRGSYNTVVGENGIKLSGGQRQRIGIARALYKNSSVIVFDEATSALDNKTESDIMEVIYNISNDVTIFIIAHRLSTLQKCDRIISLDIEI